jgi:hypothetical protein
MSGHGHAVQRLHARATDVAAERGFRLLRDRTALARFLATQASIDPRFAVDVVGIALEGGGAPTTILVDRHGHGITCLAAGMSVAAPVVPWATTTAFLDQQAQALRARQTALAVRDAAPDHSPLVRVVEHPHRLVRDELVALRTLLPLLGTDHHAAAVDAAVTEVIAVVSGRRTTDAALGASWRLLQGGVVGLVVAGHEPALAGAALAAVATGEPHLGAAALWQLVHHPEQTLTLAQALVDVDNPIAHDTLLDTVLPCLALRCRAFARDADGIACRLQARRSMPVLGLVDVEAATLEFTRQTVLLLPLLLAPQCPDDVVVTHHADVDALAARLRAECTIAAVEALASPWSTALLRVLALARRRAEPPRTMPRAEASLPEDERTARMLFRGALLEPPLPLRGSGSLFAQFVVHAPIEALWPGDDPEPALALARGVRWLRAGLPALLGVAPSSTTTNKQKKTSGVQATSTPRRQRRR